VKTKKKKCKDCSPSKLKFEVLWWCNFRSQSSEVWPCGLL